MKTELQTNHEGRYAICLNCRYFDDTTCRRHAPAPLVTLEDLEENPKANWPTVEKYDSCGEFLDGFERPKE